MNFTDSYEIRVGVGETIIDPARISCPTAAFIPSQNRIVPPDSARLLAKAIPKISVYNIDLGYIGMIAGNSAKKWVYEPLILWLKTT